MHFCERKKISHYIRKCEINCVNFVKKRIENFREKKLIKNPHEWMDGWDGWIEGIVNTRL